MARRITRRGKAILSAASAGLGAELLDGLVLERFTPKTHRSRRSLLADVAGCAERGWAFDDEEHTIGMQCVSSAILNERAEPAGAVSISGPSVRIGPEQAGRLGARVRVTARHLSELFSGLRPA